MADTDNPFAQFVQKKDQDNPFAKFATKPQVGVAEDVLKAIPSGLAKGAISVAGTGGDLAATGQAIANKAMEKTGTPDPLGWAVDKLTGILPKEGPFSMPWFRESNAKSANSPIAQVGTGDVPGTYKLPTSADIKGSVEGVTGPLYNAQTPTGKVFQTGSEVLPALVTGGGSIPGMVLKAAGAGVGSEALGEGANALKGYLPQSVQPWAEPVAHAVGAGFGTGIPSLVRRGVTPLPMSDEQFNTVNALRQSNPDLVKASTAGQLTESPRVMSLEARTSRGQNAADRQAGAFTSGIMKQAGVNGNFSDIGQGANVGQEIGNIRKSANIVNPDFNELKKNIGAARRDLQRVVGVGNTQSVDEVRNAVNFGAMNNGTPVMSMPGARYQSMRGDIQRRIDAASSPEEKTALSNIRDHLDDAFHNTVGPDQAARLQELERQYANYNVLSNIPPRVGKETVTPQEVISAVGKNWGNKAANEGRGLAKDAQNASRVMTPHPEIDKTQIPPWADLGLAGVSGLVSGAVGHHFGGTGIGLGAIPEGAVMGHLLGPSLYRAGATAAAHAVSNPVSQAYLRNQGWRPGAATSAPSFDQLVRLLASPQGKDVTGPSQ